MQLVGVEKFENAPSIVFENISSTCKCRNLTSGRELP